MLAALDPRRVGHAVHGCGATLTIGGHRCLGLAVGLYRRGRLRDFGARGRWPRRWPARLLAHDGRGTHRPWRARFAAAGGGACAFTAMTSIADRTPGRGGAGLGDPEGAPRRAARARAGFRGRSVFCTYWRRSPGAPTRRACARRPRADARRRRAFRRGRGRCAPIGAVTSGGFGPTVGGPMAMGYVAAGTDAVGTAALGRGARQAPAGARGGAALRARQFQTITSRRDDP